MKESLKENRKNLKTAASIEQPSRRRKTQVELARFYFAFTSKLQTGEINFSQEEARN